MRVDALLKNRGFRLLLSPLLIPASVLYAAGSALDRRRSLARRASLPVPTISVGNLTVGGTGKTPVLMALARELAAAGKRPFILTRGYAGIGSRSAAGIIRAPSDAAGFSDEIRLMADRLPGLAIAAGADRLSGARRILEQDGGDVALLDDGFQHWRLDRRLDIVCVDATDPWGGGWLVPMGRLRERPAALRRAGVVIVTRCESVPAPRADDVVASCRRLAPGADVVRSRFALRFEVDGREAGPLPARAVALSSIGNPAAFESSLRRAGVEVDALRFPDHHGYDVSDWSGVAARARGTDRAVITTEKDWVKLRALDRGGVRVIVAVQSLEIDAGDRDRWADRVRSAAGAR